MARKVQLIDLSECVETRKKITKCVEEGGHPGVYSFGFDSLGSCEVVTATGRATCRQCGQKIAKGKRAIKGCFDFAGCGTWTAVDVQIHFEECGVPSEEAVA